MYHQKTLIFLLVKPDSKQFCVNQDSSSNSPEDTEDASRYWLNVTNPLLQIRRASDQGLRNARLVVHIQHL